jgi:predicted phosphodiesterase
VALLADTHISGDPNHVFLGTKWKGTPVKASEHEGVNMTNCLVQAVHRILALKPRPAYLIVNGDCTFSDGRDAECKQFLRLLEPIRSAGITVHVTLGNHDDRENLRKLIPFPKKEQMDVQADVIELPRANLVLLDSGCGALGDHQLTWLGRHLDERPDKPAFIFSHFNPYPNRGLRPIPGLRDGSALLKLLAERKHVRAYVYGHTHEWQCDRRDHLYLINQPAVSYCFGKGHAHGWIDMKFTETSADLELHCINPKHTQHGDRKRIYLKDT